MDLAAPAGPTRILTGQWARAPPLLSRVSAILLGVVSGGPPPPRPRARPRTPSTQGGDRQRRDSPLRPRHCCLYQLRTTGTPHAVRRCRSVAGRRWSLRQRECVRNCVSATVHAKHTVARVDGEGMARSTCTGALHDASLRLRSTQLWIDAVVWSCARTCAYRRPLLAVVLLAVWPVPLDCLLERLRLVVAAVAISAASMV